MRKILSELALDNFTYYQVWSYLWLTSNSGNIRVFNYLDLCVKFKISKSTCSRLISKYAETFNSEKTHVELSFTGSTYTAKFYENGKPNKKAEPMNDYHFGIMSYLREYYQKKAFEYTELDQHRKYMVYLLSKITKSMQGKNLDVNDDSLRHAFETLMENIPEWWITHGQITLPSINRHYGKITNQIRAKQRGSFDQAVHDAESSDYSALLEKRSANH